ncbi:hypothetical protein [Flavobacterium humidisoli]|uniref:Uncharacterized protein n=1 Tax=Flavobacterium humidisoli TaxID=2937442 RepID=A0ABY4LXL3_9FLAO|nr:hypothetical protein [Flavobacterium humidisoli]UPZ17813.1 hypothetical protein M0M44_10790 [Flavobacterium humidisoli]
MRKKIIFLIAQIIFGIFTISAQNNGWIVTYNFSTPGESTNRYGNSTQDAFDQVNKKADAYHSAQVDDYKRQINRFNRKLTISINVVEKMKQTQVTSSKYPHCEELYKRSLESYKKLEQISQKVAENVAQGKSIKDYQNQQDEIMDKALEDYHKATELIELVENQDEILDEEAQNLILKHNLLPSEKGEIKELTQKVRAAEIQIRKLNKNIDPLKKEDQELQKLALYQTISQALVTSSKIIEKAVAMINPDKNSTKAITLTQAVVEKYLEEYYENGKSPADAINEAFQKGYEKFERDELLKVSTPIKELSRVPLLIEDIAKEIEKWNKLDKNQTLVLNKINEVLVFTNDGIDRQQKIIDRSNAASKIIIEGAIKRHLNKKKLH